MVSIEMKRKAPYLSYRTFKTFLDSLRVSGLPTRVDRSMMASKSGSTQALLLSTIRFLGLISENGIPTAELEKLINSHGQDRQEKWRAIVKRSYPQLFTAQFDLERATTREVEEVFEKEGVTSQETVRKCVTFFSLAARDAGIKLSPHIKPYAGRKLAGRRLRPVEDNRPDAIGKSEGMQTNGVQDDSALLSKFPSFDPSWTEDQIDKWLDAFRRLSRILNEAKATDHFE